MSFDHLTIKKAIIEVLKEKEEIPLIELSELLKKDKSNVYKIVKELEFQGLVMTTKRKKPKSRYYQLWIKKGLGENVSPTILDARLKVVEDNVDILKVKVKRIEDE